MVKVCDAIMGSGKSSAAITYMNEHPEKKFIYITPYVDEAKRIVRACPGLDMYEPRKRSEYSGSKVVHTIHLVGEGRSVATTHQAFRAYPDELLELIRKQQYTLIVDEDVDVLAELEENPYDIQMIIDAGYITEDENGVFCLAKDTYKGYVHRELFRMLRTRGIFRSVDPDNPDDATTFYYWQLPPELIQSFDDVYVLTYLFEGQSLYHLFGMYHIPFEYTGVVRDADGTFRFGGGGERLYIPEYTKALDKKIHILDNPKLNKIGEDHFALSMSWFNRNDSDVVAQLKNNVANYFKHICKAKASERMWSTYKTAESKLTSKGCGTSFVPFNKKAVNEYGDRTVIAYCVNLFMSVGYKLFYQRNGFDVNEDEWALSNMVQWIWRSAIRNGKEISIYIPSRRMRELLIGWIDSVTTKGAK